MKNVVKILVDYLISEKIISQEYRDVYIYGFDLLIYTVLSTTTLLLFGIVANNILGVLILLMLFYKNQSLGGGFHASTHTGCFICMVTGTILYLIMLSNPSWIPLDVIIMLSSIIVLWKYPLVLHQNKAYLKENHPELIRNSRKLVLRECLVLVIVIIIRNETMRRSIIYSLMLCAISRLVAAKLRPRLCFR